MTEGAPLVTARPPHPCPHCTTQDGTGNRLARVRALLHGCGVTLGHPRCPLSCGEILCPPPRAAASTTWQDGSEAHGTHPVQRSERVPREEDAASLWGVSVVYANTQCEGHLLGK